MFFPYYFAVSFLVQISFEFYWISILRNRENRAPVEARAQFSLNPRCHLKLEFRWKKRWNLREKISQKSKKSFKKRVWKHVVFSRRFFWFLVRFCLSKWPPKKGCSEPFFEDAAQERSRASKTRPRASQKFYKSAQELHKSAQGRSKSVPRASQKRLLKTWGGFPRQKERGGET